VVFKLGADERTTRAAPRQGARQQAERQDVQGVRQQRADAEEAIAKRPSPTSWTRRDRTVTELRDSAYVKPFDLAERGKTRSELVTVEGVPGFLRSFTAASARLRSTSPPEQPVVLLGALEGRGACEVWADGRPGRLGRVETLPTTPWCREVIPYERRGRTGRSDPDRRKLGLKISERRFTVDYVDATQRRR
jgi:hypothetical protein